MFCLCFYSHHRECMCTEGYFLRYSMYQKEKRVVRRFSAQNIGLGSPVSQSFACKVPQGASSTMKIKRTYYFTS